jgi:hypothetical protein
MQCGRSFIFEDTRKVSVTIWDPFREKVFLYLKFTLAENRVFEARIKTFVFFLGSEDIVGSSSWPSNCTGVESRDVLRLDGEVVLDLGLTRSGRGTNDRTPERDFFSTNSTSVAKVADFLFPHIVRRNMVGEG